MNDAAALEAWTPRFQKWQEEAGPMFAKGKAAGVETRGIADHGFIQSIYFRDPNGYVIELTCKLPGDHSMDPAAARATLDVWQATQSGA